MRIATIGMEQQIKEQVVALLQAGKREDAKTLLIGKFSINEEQAEQLIQVLEQENPLKHVVQPMFTRTFNQSGSQGSGCIVLVLTGFKIFFGLITFMMLAVAIGIYIYTNRFAGDAHQVEGTVVSFRLDDTNASAPVVEYRWRDSLRVYESTMYSTPPAYTKGEIITLLINPDDTEEILIDSFTERYLIPVVFGSIGVFFLFLTIGIHVASKKIKGGFDKST